MAERTGRPVFPFTALVGQEQMKLALLLNAVNPRLGGVLIRGQKGSAKSTAVRALANLLPDITVVADCPYGCNPDDPAALCDDCASRSEAGEDLPRRQRRAPLIELPIGASEDRVIGTLDLEQAISEGRRRFEPGLLAHANRGILYVDEVNLLQDHLVDVLLDAAAMGRNYVEREGVSVSHPAEFLLVGTMNPEEGDLRPQLLDRFALMVDVAGLPEPAERAEVVRRRIAFDRGPAAFAASWSAAEAAERARLQRARLLLEVVTMSDSLLDLITRICAAFEVDGLRADIVMYRAATTLAAYAGRETVSLADVRQAAELALPHRKRRQPFEQPQLDQDRLEQLLHDYQQSAAQDGGNAEEQPPESPDETSNGGGKLGPSNSPASQANADSEEGDVPGEGAPDRVVSAGSPAAPVPLPSVPARRQQGERLRAGRRTPGVDVSRGGAVGSRAPDGAAQSLALAATIRAAAPHQQLRRQRRYEAQQAPEKRHIVSGDIRQGLQPALLLRPWDIRERVYAGRLRNLILFVVDASGSMGARDRMATTKTAILSLLLDAYRRRDRIGLLTFRDRTATLALPPTNSVDLAQQRLAALPTGGRTPLSAAVVAAQRLLASPGARAISDIPLVVLVSDGRSNVALGGGSAFPEALTAARSLAARLTALGGSALLVDTEYPGSRLGFGVELAGALGARHVRLDDLREAGPSAANGLAHWVRAARG